MNTLVSAWGIMHLIALPIPVERWLGWPTRPKAMVLLGSLFALVCAGFVIKGVHHGIPAMNDTYDYILQARALSSGYLTIPDVGNAQLFGLQHAAGKYPLGFPAILAPFDWLGVPWLANPVLGGATVAVLFFFVRAIEGERVAAIAALALAACPWFVFNAAGHLSHIATGLWLLCFSFSLHTLLRCRYLRHAALAGLFLGLALLTRPFDAAVYAFPVGVVAVVYVLRNARVWLLPFALLGVIVLAAIGLYLLINSAGRADALQTGYGDSPLGALMHQMPGSPLEYLSWLHESTVAMSGLWWMGVFPAAVAWTVGLWSVAKSSDTPRLWLASGFSLLLGYGLFVFKSTFWLGPRWYVPLTPLAAYLVAKGVVAAGAVALSQSGGAARLARGYLRGIALVYLAAWSIAVPIWLYESSQRPPHGVDGRLLQAVQRQGLDHAVVALSEDYYCTGTTQPTYKILRAAGWTMRIPFSTSPVIYVNRIPGWERTVRERWPDRAIYVMSDQCEDFTLIRIH